MASDPVVVRQFRRASAVCAGLAALIGLTALIGWVTANDLLKGGFGASITMKANTSVCLLLAGASILFLIGERPGWLRRIPAWLCALLVMGVGTATLSEHLFHVDLGIDQVLFQEPPGAPLTASPNRMGPPASTCFIVVGVALLLLDWRTRRGRAPFQTLALLAMFGSLISILGYLFQVHQLYGIASVSSIALPTSVAIFLLGAAVLLARPEAGFMLRMVGEDSGSLLVRRLLPAALLLPIFLMSLRVLGERAGLYDLEFGRALLVLTFIFAFAALIWWTGGIVSRQERLGERVRSEIQGRLVRGLEDADRRKNRFLATLAHELRNPLAPVRNAVQLLRMKRSPDPEVQWAESVIERQVSYLSRLIEDLMDVSRISYGKLELRKERVALTEIVASAIEGGRPMIEGQNHELRVRLPNEPLVLDADPVRLAQVLLNLLTNAAKYTPPGGVITLSAEREGSDVLLRVSDTGVGLAPDQRPHLFEMFFQTEELERTQGGLGIGLALVRHLVELHGGTVTAHSEGTDRGSEFRVRLPLATSRPEASRPVPAGTPERPHLEGLRVLVVDDNEDAATSLAILLEHAGATARTARDGETAVELADSTEFEIALLDIGLPKMNGHDVAREIRKRPWGSKAVLIALTGWGQDGDRELSREAGFDHHLVKPVSPEALLKLLGEITRTGVGSPGDDRPDVGPR